MPIQGERDTSWIDLSRAGRARLEWWSETMELWATDLPIRVTTDTLARAAEVRPLRSARG